MRHGRVQCARHRIHFSSLIHLPPATMHFMTLQIRLATCLLVTLMVCLLGSAKLATAQDKVVAQDNKISFNRQIRPILSDRCFQCHGPSDAAREADLRLDLADHAEGPFADRDGQRILAPKQVESSILWQRITTEDEAERMPPVGSNKQPLTDEERELIRQWITEGAEYDLFWAFVPPRRQKPPIVVDRSWASERIDQFVLARLDRENITPKSRADKRTLIRRVTLDLTGLPPTTDEIKRFLEDGSPTAYKRLVDRLIATHRYGEHMSKYWLDVARFADTNGIHHDHYRETTPYRDWVIRAFNQNLPYDDFIEYQLAGDLYEQPTQDQQIASGFNRLHLVIDRGTALPQESFTRNVVDRVSAVGTAFMGLTLGCAACHDHKYDPVTQRDFYQLFAFFNNIDTTPETPGRNPHPPFIRVPTAEQIAQLSLLENRIADAKSQLDALKEIPDAAKLKVHQATLKELEKVKTELEKGFAYSLVSRERTEIRPAYILTRGAYDDPGEEVGRGTPGFLPPINAEGEVKTRMDLARWLTDSQHPLTARVTVNRFWQQLFGVGLVKTSEDFGAQGEFPSHPALLDDLASGFIESGWDVKALVRAMVLSQTYQQSSRASVDEFERDADNRLLARGSRFRLDSEMIRDQILIVSGSLDQTLYGRSVKPPQPPNLWKSVSMVSSSTYAFQADNGADIYRRSLYSFWKRAMPPPQMTIFDAPTRESCIARRERTNTPVQALVLMNEGQYFQAARRFAGQVLARDSSTEDARLAYAYESITSHVPDAEELASLSRGLSTMREAYREDVAAAKQLTANLGKNMSDDQRIELAAYTMLVNSLFSLDITKTRE
jgi:hypothetical protein